MDQNKKRSRLWDHLKKFSPFIAGGLYGLWSIYGEKAQKREVFYTISSLAKPKRPNLYSVLTYNVGNKDHYAQKYDFNLYKKDVFERIRQNIRKLSPDIIAIQEILAPHQCKNAGNVGKNEICHKPPKHHIIKDLLGKEYQIVCDNRTQYVCTAIKKSIGKILDNQGKDFYLSNRIVPEVKGCDNKFVTLIGTIHLNNGAEFDLVNIHLPSLSAKCRAFVLRKLFFAENQLLRSDKLLIMGDLNMDIWRHPPKRIDIRTWHTICVRGYKDQPFRYHSGLVEASPPYTTSYLLKMPHTTDVIISNFAQGICVVMGQSKNTFRLDGGEGTDHLALFGFLNLK